MIKAVSFDVGETIVDETHEYGTWADWLNVPCHTFSAVFGAVIARGEDYRDAFKVFQPDFDLARERQKRIDSGKAETFGEEDLYPDVRPALSALKKIGIDVVLAGNQTKHAGVILRGLFPEVDTIITSDSVGIEKPSRDFFLKIAETTGLKLGEILYVGDRLDNDISPAQAVGMPTALIKRGPWSYILDSAQDDRSSFRIDSLIELTPLIEAINQQK